MKKILLAGFLASLNAAAFAQVKIAPEIGATMYNQTSKVTIAGQSASTSSDFQPGLRAGANLDFTISDHISIQPGVFYNLNRTKSESKSEAPGMSSTTKTTTMLHAIQVPVYAVYKTGEEGSGRFFAGIGGYAAYNIAGKQKMESSTNINGNITDLKSDVKIKFGNDKADHMKPLDYGPSVMLGYELSNGLYARGNFNYGLANMLPQGNSDASIKSMSFGISVGYFFGNSGGYNGW